MITPNGEEGKPDAVYLEITASKNGRLDVKTLNIENY
jgi:hypothetical protein